MNLADLESRAKALIPGAAQQPAAAAAIGSGDSSWTAGPPGWIYCGALSCVLIWAHWRASRGDSLALLYLDKAGNGGTGLLGVMLGSLLGYRGWHGHLRAKVAIATQQAAAPQANGAVQP